MARKTLVVCGNLASFLYVAMTLLIGILWEDYSSWSQTISELSAIGAPKGVFGFFWPPISARCWPPVAAH